MHGTNRKIGKLKRRKVRGISYVQELSLRESLRLTTPSEPWIDAQFIAVPDTDEHGCEILRTLHIPSVFPPGGAETAMVRCPQCEIFNPPIAFEQGLCLDHSEEDRGWGRSPSAVALEKLRLVKGRVEEMALEPESIPALCAEIGELEKNSPRSHYQTLENVL